MQDCPQLTENTHIRYITRPPGHQCCGIGLLRRVKTQADAEEAAQSLSDVGVPGPSPPTSGGQAQKETLWGRISLDDDILHPVKGSIRVLGFFNFAVSTNIV